MAILNDISVNSYKMNNFNISALQDKLGSKSSPGLPVSCPFALSLSIASVAENVMGGASGGVCTLMALSYLTDRLPDLLFCVLGCQAAHPSLISRTNRFFHKLAPSMP